MPAADFIIISTLASGHLDIAYLLKDCISSGQHIIAMNSNWAVYEILGILEDSVKEKDITISETSGVHLMSDLVSPGHCILKKIKNRIGISTYPKCKGADVVKNLSGVFPQLYSLGSPVESSMNTSNPILHAPIALFNLSKIEAGIDHFFYRDGGTPLVVKYIEKIDSERLAVLQALGVKGQSCLDIVNKAWNTTYSNLYDAIQANYPNSKGPKSIRYRFITEDVPYGIVPILKIGHLLNINVPFNEKLIDMYSAVLDNDFMNAVKNKEKIQLFFYRKETGEKIVKTIDAYNVFHKMCEMNWDYAEPGVLYWDTINSWNLLSEEPEFSYAGTNPCAEEPLPAGGSCLLGSINLSAFVNSKKEFDFDEFKKTVRLAVKALNEVLDEGAELHPLEEQRESVKKWRQIGLGIMGLADMLIKMNIRYGSKESISLCDRIGYTMTNEAIRSSALLAKEFGTYPAYSDNILKSLFYIDNTDVETKELVQKYGLRNSQLLTIAPTGTISTMLQISGGIEPIFANYYIRCGSKLHFVC